MLSAAEGVSPKAYKLTELFGLPLTNAILTTWVISLVLILVIRFSVGKPQMVPSKGQIDKGGGGGARAAWHIRIEDNT